ncbi:non-oxidative hydroxyarylic acid decarboxylases subunit D [Streptomyces sp. NPDC057684]|uniref:non-oxidative hydroxyarylic acid decarboxylases subunit D n=1 Tax=unclassified Streptomyces TaxID=2593676 RepID=UPI0036C50CC1
MREPHHEDGQQHAQHLGVAWRTVEPARRTRRDAYPDSFELTAEDIENAIEVPAVPPLLK